MSEFTESIDDLIVRHFTDDAIRKLQDSSACDVKDWKKTDKILERLIRTSIAHARKQAEGRKTGTMTFDEAIGLARKRNALVTRPSWGIMRGINRGPDGSPWNFKPDNTEGLGSGEGWPYTPTDEDLAATDWMFYQTPDDNWVELDFYNG